MEVAKLHFLIVPKNTNLVRDLIIADAVYRMNEKGQKVEFFDLYSTSYIVVRVGYSDVSTSQSHAADEDD